MPEIVVNPSLTDIGKKRLSEGRFEITKASVSDDGINYRLIDTSFQDPLLALKRTKLFNVWKDASSQLQNKIPIRGEDSVYTNSPIPLNFNRLQSRQINVGGKLVQHPEINNSDVSQKSVVFYGFEGTDRNHLDVRIEVPFQDNPILRGSQYVTFTLESNKYFDIFVSPQNRTNYRDADFSRLLLTGKVGSPTAETQTVLLTRIDLPDPNLRIYIEDIQKETEDKLTPNYLFTISDGMDAEEEVRENLNIKEAQELINKWSSSGRTPMLINIIEPTLAESVFERNFDEAISPDLSKAIELPKTANIFCTDISDVNNSIILRYRGNYVYKNADNNFYSTFLNVFSETTGHFEKIKLSIVSTESTPIIPRT